LELNDKGDQVPERYYRNKFKFTQIIYYQPEILDIRGYMILGRGIEILLASHYRWLNSGVFVSQLPEGAVPVGLVHFSAEQRPAILVHGEGEGQEYDLVQGGEE